MNSSLIDALNEVDRNIGEQSKTSTPNVHTSISPASTELQHGTSAVEFGYTNDIAIINDHDYVRRSSGMSSTKTQSSQSNIRHCKNLLVTSASVSNALTVCGDITTDAYDLSDDISDSQSSPPKRGRGGRDNARSHGRGGQGRGQGKVWDRLPSHTSGQENNQHKADRQMVLMKGNAINVNMTPQYKLTVSNSNTPDKKPRLQLIHIQPTSSASADTTMPTPTCCKKQQKGTGTGTSEVGELSGVGRVSEAEDVNKPDTCNLHLTKEAQEILCPNCGTWSSTFKHCSSCEKDFSQQLPKKFRNRNGHVGMCTSATSHGQDRNTTAPAATLPLVYVVSKTDPKQMKVSLCDTSNATGVKHAKHTGSHSVNTSKNVLATNMFYKGKIAVGSSPYMSLCNARKTLNQKTKKRPNRGKKPEPVVISIDSDSEDDNSGNLSGPSLKVTQRKLASTICNSAVTSQEPDEDITKRTTLRRSLMRDQFGKLVEDKSCKSQTSHDTCQESNATSDVMSNGAVVDLPAIMLRFGSLSIEEPAQVQFSSVCFKFCLGIMYPASEILLDTKHLVSCKYYLSYGIPTICLETTGHFANMVRERLRMVKGQAFFDPGSKDDAERRIIFRPKQDPLTAHSVSCLQSIFQQIAGAKGIPKDTMFIKMNKMTVNKFLGQCRPSRLDLDREYILRIGGQEHVNHKPESNICIIRHKSVNNVDCAEPESKTLNDESTPAFYCVDEMRPKNRSVAVSADDSGEEDVDTIRNVQQPVVILVYPPAPMKGGIILHEVDVKCLQEGEFLNDVIIDFYIKYLINQVLSDADRQKTFVFSSFFYGRLMRREYSREKSSQDTLLSRMEKRHHKVWTWTRNVDIFQKDFIIVPINEHSHWYVAIICYPGLVADPGYMKECEAASSVLPLATVSDSCGESTLERVNMQMAVQEEVVSDVMLNGSADSTASQNYPINCSSGILLKTQNNEEPMEVDDTTACPVTSDFTTDLGQGTLCGPRCTNRSADSTSEVVRPHCSVKSEDLLYSQYQKVHCRRPCILIFDSLGGPSRRNVIQNLREYLTVEWQTRKNSKCVFDAKTIKGCQPKVPQQNNFSDCGIFLLQYVQMFFQKPINNFSIPIKGLDLWFQDAAVSKKRREIYHLIYELKRVHGASYR